MLSVIICTHNPRADYLQRVLDSCKNQTLPRDQWELLLVDNASTVSLKTNWDLSWHPHARHLDEMEPGLTNARLCGIQEAKGDLLVFVDDDNILNPTYLEKALKIAHDWPVLGIWGAGKIDLEFEVEPASWTRPYWMCFCKRDLTAAQWGNTTGGDIMPIGAGLCIRSSMAKAYEAHAKSNNISRMLDRKGTLSTACAGDIEMGLQTLQQGLGSGLFPELQLNHLIPAQRLDTRYFEKWYEGYGESLRLLHWTTGQVKAPTDWIGLLIMYLKTLRMPPLNRKFRLAEIRGIRRADALFASSHK